MSKSQNGKPKGIDDAINEKHEVTTISGEAADHHLKIIASQHGLNLDHKGDKEEWPDAPEEIPTHPDLPDINAESIPPLFRNYIQTCCENLQVPFLFVLIPLMFSMSAIIGSGLRLRPKKMDKSWHVTSNLWAILIGPPSVKKSPSLEAGLAPLKYVEAYERERYESESKLWESKFQALEAERQGVLDAIKRKAAGNKDSQELTATLEDRLKSIISELSKAPKRIQIHTNDSTQEALLSLESNNRTGISIVRDELVGLIKKITNDRDLPGQNGSM